MSYIPQAYVRTNQKALGVTAFVGAAGTVMAGNAINLNEVDDGSLVALVYAQATTNTLTLAAKWQALDWADGTTWRDIVDSNNPANVALVTGTGSAVAATKYVSAPSGAYGAFKQVRCVVVSGGAAAGAGDEFNIAYGWRMPWY